MDRKIIELLQAGTSLCKIAASLRVGDRRIRRLRCLAEEHGYLGDSPRPLRPYPQSIFCDEPEPLPGQRTSEADTALLAKQDWIRERLALGWQPITVYEEIGIAVARSSFYRFLQRHDLQVLGEKARTRLRVVGEIIHMPGEALLLDWGKLRDVTDPKTRNKARTLGVRRSARVLTPPDGPARLEQ